jgi:hypothetical protein
MSTILSVFFVKAHQNLGNINLVLGLVIKIERIKKPPTSPLKPHYLQFDGVRHELTVLSKALQGNKAIRPFRGAGCVDRKRQRSLQSKLGKRYMNVRPVGFLYVFGALTIFIQ